jgi:ASC-1-like (ASCH) protein
LDIYNQDIGLINNGLQLYDFQPVFLSAPVGWIAGALYVGKLSVMQIFQSGRSTEYMNGILAENKTVEGRLNRGKFSQYQPGDLVYLREDVPLPGGTVREIPNRALIKITIVDSFPTFERMLSLTRLELVLPRAKSIADGEAIYRAIYPAAEEAEYGVLAIHFELLQENPATLTR